MNRQWKKGLGLALVGLLVMTGCFQIRGFYFTKRIVERGKSVTLVLDMRPYSKDAKTHVIFFMVGFTEDGDTGTGVAKLKPDAVWDANGKFNGPKILVEDGELRNHVRDSEDCSLAFDFDAASETIWTALRTPGPVNNKGAITRTALTKLPIKSKPGTTHEGFNMTILTGIWTDTNNSGVPNDQETQCFPPVVTSLPIKD